MAASNFACRHPFIAFIIFNLRLIPHIYSFIHITTQAWRAAIENVKAQLLHQENRLLNAELAEGGLGSLWLQQNATVDQVSACFELFVCDITCVCSFLSQLQKWSWS